MASLNKVTLIGNLGRDPEIRSTQNGSKLANLALATTEKWTDKQSGEKKEKTEWHKVVIYNERLADLAERYLSKGSQIYIEGALQTRKWTDNQGVEKYTTEVVLKNYAGDMKFLSGGKPQAGTTYQGNPDGSVIKTNPNGNNAVMDDDIPF